MALAILYAAVFAVGGACYGLLELAARGRTHWTMLAAGGLCSVFLYMIAGRRRGPLWKKCLLGGAVITAVEFVTGLVVNLLLGLNVWSYDRRPLNLLGQVCPLFSLLWVLLSAPALSLCTFVSGRLKRR